YRIVTVCAQGCDYTAIDTAANNNASTCAAPIFFWLGPGSFTTSAIISAQQDCSVFAGQGTGITVQGTDQTTQTLNFSGTTNNVTIRDMTLRGNNPIGGNIGGRARLINLEIVSTGTSGTGEDCWNFATVPADLWLIGST